jgi:hypothetical protein
MFASRRTDIPPARAEFEKFCFVDEILETTDATKRDGLGMGWNSHIPFVFGGNYSDPQVCRSKRDIRLS